MSTSTSARARGFMATNVSGFSRSLAMVSCLYGMEPITRAGFSAKTRSASSDQQSPSFGSFPTGATSAHHLLTPTIWRSAPSAHKMDVALGASETILRAGPPSSVDFAIDSGLDSALLFRPERCLDANSFGLRRILLDSPRLE